MKNTNTKTLTRVALLVAIELVMKLVGLGSVPMGPLYMSFLTLPIAVGAITMGPAVGALLGGVFGAVSFYDAITGASAMTGALFQVSPLNTFILCVGMRMLMGLCCGLIFKGLQKLDKYTIEGSPRKSFLRGYDRSRRYQPTKIRRYNYAARSKKTITVRGAKTLSFREPEGIKVLAGRQIYMMYVSNTLTNQSCNIYRVKKRI